MPYPVSPPPLPAVIEVVPEEFNHAISATIAAPTSTSPPEFIDPQTTTTPSIDSALSADTLPPADREDYETAFGAESLGAPIEIGVSVQSAPFSSNVLTQSTSSESPGESPRATATPALEAPAQHSSVHSQLLSQEDRQEDLLQETETEAEQPPQETEAEEQPIAPDETAPGEILEIPAPESEQTPEAVDEQNQPPSPGEATEGQPGLPIDPMATQDIIELDADRQEYDEQQQVFRAQGNVELRFREAVLTADRLQVNIPNRIAVADGNAVLTRGQQVLRGERIEYNLVQNQGRVLEARGELFLPTIESDTAQVPPVDLTAGQETNVPLTARLSAQQPLQVLGSQGGVTLGVGSDPSSPVGSTGQISRLRYEADEIEFVGENWQATNVRITNDPFSPPELELRSRLVTVTPLSPTQTEIRARNPRLVFDQGLSLPLLQDRVVIDRRQRNPGLFSFGYDEEDRGGFFIERPFEFIIGDVANLSLTPQVLVQRAIDEDGFGDLSSYGLIARLDVDPTPTTSIRGNAVFTSLDLGDEEFDDTFRASFRARQLAYNHTIALEYSYRDRLYNGSLGFQDVRSSLGLVVTSPNYILGDSQINLSYQAGVQLINADSNSERRDEPDIQDLLPEPNEFGAIPNARIDLTRYQASVSANRLFLLWAGTPLPPTPEEGLRYTSNPVVPYLAFGVGARGVFSAYSNGDTQSVLTGTVGLFGQFGRFSRPFLDYTGFNVSYSYNAIGGETPFEFDRVNDIQVLDVGITQQVYGPFRVGARAAFFLESRAEREEDYDATFFLEYSRRTYSITLSYSPSREAGSLNFIINDFNWVGDPGPFSGIGASNVSGGVRIPGD